MAISRIAFGNKENISVAVQSEAIDSYDILFLSNGEVAWINADNNPVINTPRLQNDITIDSTTVVNAETTIEDALQLLYKATYDTGENEVVEFDSAMKVVNDETLVVEF